MFKLRAPLSPTTFWIIGGGSTLLLILVWLGLTLSDTISARVVPGPMELLQAVPRMHYEHYMVANALVSLLRITIGFALATMLAIPLGVMMAAFTPVKASFWPIMVPMRFLPIAAVVPIFIAWFGFGEVMKIMVLFLGTFIYLLPLVVETANQVDDVYLKTASTLGASRWQAITTILLPASLPAIFEAIRVLYGVGWTYVMLAEFVSEESTGFGYGGIGFLINTLRRYGTLADVLVAVALIMIIGVLVDIFLAWTGRQLFPWALRNKK